MFKITARVDPISGIETGTKALQKAVLAAQADLVMGGGLIIETEAKILCPVRTGTLRRSIHTEVAINTFNKVSVAVGPDDAVTYAPYVEFGTSRMSARPYMRPAFESKKDEVVAYIVSNFRDTVLRALQDETARVAARRRIREAKRSQGIG